MTDDDDISFLVRARRALRSTAQRSTDEHDQADGASLSEASLIGRVRDRVEQTLAPAIEDAAQKMLLKLAEPENAQKLQETLAGVAQFAMKSGFRSDPQAGLLFDFVDQLETRHSRPEVLEIVVEHAMVYEQDLVATLIEAIKSGQGVAGLAGRKQGAGRKSGTDRFEAFRDRASTRLLTLLCSLASLDSDDPAPDSRAAKVAYFEQAPIDARFKPLARMATGEREAFEVAQNSEEGSHTHDPDPDSPSLVRRAINRLAGEANGEANGNATTALARFVPSLRDPGTRFLTTSYLFFMQSYLVRAMIEELPAMLAAVRDLEQEAQNNQQADTPDDIIEIND
jgi:hypothetical protein